jgi:hypothetical protein
VVAGAIVAVRAGFEAFPVLLKHWGAAYSDVADTLIDAFDAVSSAGSSMYELISPLVALVGGGLILAGIGMLRNFAGAIRMSVFMLEGLVTGLELLGAVLTSVTAGVVSQVREMGAVWTALANKDPVGAIDQLYRVGTMKGFENLAGNTQYHRDRMTSWLLDFATGGAARAFFNAQALPKFTDNNGDPVVDVRAQPPQVNIGRVEVVVKAEVNADPRRVATVLGEVFNEINIHGRQARRQGLR